MSSVYYVQVQGRTLGPMDEAELMRLFRAGQLSLHSLVSPDGVSWTNLGSLPAFSVFAGQSPGETPPFTSSSVGSSAGIQAPPVRIGVSAGSVGQSGMSAGERWYVHWEGQTQGPMSQTALIDLISRGAVGPTALVWHPSMTNWQSLEATDFARYIPGRPQVDAGPFAAKGTPPILGGQKYCSSCGRVLALTAEICPNCGASQAGPVAKEDRPNRVVAFLLAFFFGALGIHKFYLGQTGWGLVYLILFVLFWWTIIVPIVLGLVAFVEGIIYLTYSDEGFARKYRRRRR
ncbi:MAG: GYF domain-containing protein [Thermoguttaceae bacterium]|nr:GYF domain-containing protein [Thermoguttaceae bacterium]MDW8077631.1 GYF domain-containing protein [Thermoguttaceae bacterium]